MMRVSRWWACAVALVALSPAVLAANATLTIHFTNLGLPLEDPLQGRFYVYEPDNDESYVAWGHADQSVTVPAGVYRIVIKYVNGSIHREQVLEDVELAGDVEREVDFQQAVARLTIAVDSGGLPVPRFSATCNVYHAGQRGQPLASKRPGETIVIAPGIYDVEVLYRAAEGLESRWLEGYSLEGERYETVEVGSRQVSNVPRQVDIGSRGDRITVQVRNRGRRVADAWCALYPPGDHARASYSGASGESIAAPPGTYDVGCFLQRDGIDVERWLPGQVVAGPVEVEVDLAFTEASFRVRPPRRAREATGASNLLLVVDSSADMAADLDGRSRLDQLRETLVPAIDSLGGTGTSVGLRAYGITPRQQGSCDDSTLLVPVSGVNRGQLARSLGLLRPTGSSPIARSLEVAPADLPSTGPRFVVLLAGGGDSCSGDVCAAAARAVHEGGLTRIYVVGLGAGRELRRELDCAGQYRVAGSKLELDTALRQILREVRRGGAGSVTLFAPGWSRLVASGPLLERLSVTEGTYDVLIRSGDDTFAWPGFEIRGVMDVTAGARPPRSR